MSHMDSGSESDGAPEELTAVQGVVKHEEITKVEKDSAIRATREGKERRKRWAQRKTSSKPNKQAEREVQDEEAKPDEENEETHTVPGMLPSNVIEILAAREKQTFESDSEEENVKQNVQKRKKKLKSDGPETILLKDVRAIQQIKNAIDFLERRKNQVPRSNAVLKNASTALRLISLKGMNLTCWIQHNLSLGLFENVYFVGRMIHVRKSKVCMVGFQLCIMDLMLQVLKKEVQKDL